MANGSLDSKAILVRCFAEFDLLPDLMYDYSQTRGQPGDHYLRWARVLDARGYNDDHVDDRFIPDGMSLTEFMAEDALWFCHRTGLIGSRGGMGPRGRLLARIGRTAPEDRTIDDARELTRALAAQIQTRYLGADDLPLTDLLQAASAILASHGHAWPDGLEGLLLVEMGSLLHWGSVDPNEVERLVHRLPEIRREVIRALRKDPEVIDRSYSIDAVDVADLLVEVHWGRDDLGRHSDLTVMGLRATAMAMTFAQILRQTFFLSPVQVLQPIVKTGNAR